MNKILMAVILTPFFLTVSACGGGGSESSDNTTSDTTPPIIRLIGDAAITIEVGTSYSDDGATANDNNDGNITNKIVTVNPVDTNALGSYTVTYNVSDAAGNKAIQVTRTVNLVDTTVPIITLIGEDTLTLTAKSEYNDAGATATDNFDGALTPTSSSTVNTNVVGSYTVTYAVSDSSGNSATPVIRTVNVVDPVSSSLLPPQVPSL